MKNLKLFEEFGNESIVTMKTKFKSFKENIHSNIDPLGEENWDDDNKFNIGDKIGFVKINMNGEIVDTKRVDGYMLTDPDDEPYTIYIIKWENPQIKTETEFTEKDLNLLIQKNIFKKI